MKFRFIDDNKEIRRIEKMVNLNKLAVTICKKEKGKQEVNIAQVKEIMKILLTELANTTNKELVGILNRYRNKAKGAKWEATK